MKEATGDLNLALMAIIIVGILIAFFYSAVWPSLKKTIGISANCNRAVCENVRNNDGTVDCRVYDKFGNPEEVTTTTSIDKYTFTCTWKG